MLIDYHPPRSAFLGAVAGLDALFLGVGSGRLFDHAAHQRTVGVHPVGDDLPLAAVPLLELHLARTFMVGTGDLEGRHEAGGTQGFQAGVIQIEVLEAPANLLTGQGLALAVLLLSLADRLDGDDAVHHATVVIHRADAGLVFHVALVLAVHMLLDVGHDRVVGTRHVEAGGNEALGCRTGRDGVFLGAGPPHADQLFTGEAGLGGGLDGGRVHHAPAPQHHVVGLGLADLQPLGLLLVARVGHGDLDHLKAVLGGQLVHDGVGLLAVGGVVIEQADLLTLQLVHATFLLAHEVHDGGSLGPVGGDHREDPREDPAVRRIRATVADGDHRDLVLGDLLEHGIGDAGGDGLEHGVAGAALLLHALVAFDTAGVVVFGLALFPGQLDTVHSTITLVDELHVVDPAAEQPGTTGSVGADAIARQADKLLLVGAGHGGTQQAGDDRAQQNGFLQFHVFVSSFMVWVLLAVGGGRPDAFG